MYVYGDMCACMYLHTRTVLGRYGSIFIGKAVQYTHMYVYGYVRW